MKYLALGMVTFMSVATLAQTSTDSTAHANAILGDASAGPGQSVTPTTAVGATATTAPTPAEKNKSAGIKVTGAARIRYEDQARTSSYSTSRSFWSMRFRPNITWETEAGVKVVVEPQVAKRFGQEAYTAGQNGSGAATVSLTETSGNTSYPGDSITAHQAFAEVALSEGVRTRLGRMRLVFGDQTMMGPGDWGTYSRSFDAILLNVKSGAITADLFQAKIADLGSASEGGDRDLNGLYLTYQGGDALKTVDVYALERVDLDRKVTATTDTGSDSRYNVYGARFAGAPGDYGYSLEYAKGAGSSNFVGDGSNADMWILRLNTPSMSGHVVGVEATSAGENWNEMYPTTNKALGRADVLGRRNLQSQALFVKSEWTERWQSEMWAYFFQRNSTSRRIYGTNGTSAFGSTTSTEKNIGSEVDLVISYRPDKSLTWTGGACAFLPGAYLNDTLDQAGRDDRDSHYAFLMVESKF